MYDGQRKERLTFLKAEIQPAHADVLLFACCLCSGLVDSTLYNAYNTFVSMQTGNTIFVGSFIFARLNRLFGPKKRGTLILSFGLQVVMLILTACLVQSGVIAGLPLHNLATAEPDWTQEVPIVLLSIQSAGQIVASRALGYNEIPTVVITSLLCDLMSDPKLFLLRNEKRDRRIIAFVLTLVGAIAGGWITKGTGDIYAALWIAAGIKLGIASAWLFWKEELDLST
ncbi:hypothetical protein ANOM_003620 [Aspergillus nomiae NRRL 13137]|uniref:DUF1275 domain protein n=1 Tax=Aspergillus nomiae NRRL (strain ATCC 15546 / NRRL 13137 / CBS 260.88 / M93) TaxID=1509407 RepID=A0A0L1J7J0_ASPN3|nr:uncharacterized protein ANOM_003620 [Aspergillus nomiae NRRL 13137]KNG87640.1 hypothetical protein ANOM_003620 [Aspergillus nomiae NRRL 13137]